MIENYFDDFHGRFAKIMSEALKDKEERSRDATD